MENKYQVTLLIIALIIGNFLYQFISKERNWVRAYDRSFFQLIAVLITYGLFA